MMNSTNKPTTAITVKFLSRYDGRILPRPSDGNLRYVGGHTRVVSVLRSVSYSELIAKLSEMCGYSVALRCQLPSDEMDVLVSVKSDEDLASIIDEYDRASLINAGKDLKIKAILSPPKPPQTKSNNSSPSSSLSYADFSPTKSDDADHRRYFCSAALNLCPQATSPPLPIGFLSDCRSGSSKARLPYKFDWNPNQFQPCHMQAHYMPLVLHSNYRQ